MLTKSSRKSIYHSPRPKEYSLNFWLSLPLGCLLAISNIAQAELQVGGIITSATNGSGKGAIVSIRGNTGVAIGRGEHYANSSAGLFKFTSAAGNTLPAPRDTLNGQNAGEQFGFAAVNIGDKNGDLFDDLAISAHTRNVAGNTEAGAVDLISSMHAITTTGSPALNGLTCTLARSNINNQQRFGISLAKVGRYLVVGAPLDRNGGASSRLGAVYIYDLNQSINTLCSGVETRRIIGTQADAEFGFAVANLGDINGDGHDDLGVSSPSERNTTSSPRRGAVRVYNLTTIATTGSETPIGSRILGIQPNGNTTAGALGFGRSLAGLGNVHPSGADEFVVGAPLKVRDVGSGMPGGE